MEEKKMDSLDWENHKRFLQDIKREESRQVLPEGWKENHQSCCPICRKQDKETA